MESKEARIAEESTKVRPLTDKETSQISGGHSHSRPSGNRCNWCGKTFVDAGTLFEHQKMVHGK